MFDLTKQGEIGSALKARVVDANKPVQFLALDIVGRIATGMGKQFEKHTKLLVTAVATVLADQKAPIRQAGLNTLNAIAIACDGLDASVVPLSTALESPNPLQKGTLLTWINDWFKEHQPASTLDLSPWAPVIVAALDDRNVDVRKGAQGLLPVLIAASSFDHVMKQMGSLKPASRNTAMPLIQAAQKAAAPAKVVAMPQSRSTTKALPPAVAPPSNSLPPPPDQPPGPTASKMAKVSNVRRPLPTSSRSESPVDAMASTPAVRAPAKSGLGGLKRPIGRTTSAKPTPASQPVVDTSLAFHTTDPDARRLRVARDSQRWINEGGPARKDLAELLRTQMDSHASKTLIDLLFSSSHNPVSDNVTGLGMMIDFYASAQGDEVLEPICLANLDFPLKYVSLKIHESQPNLVSRCVDTAESIVAFLRNAQYQLTESEALCFIPTLIYKVRSDLVFTRSNASS